MFIIIVLRFTRIFSEKDVKNMKIEKVNDNQIRCTLTREDLEDRHIKISELAYGSAKAKSLFKDMVEQAITSLALKQMIFHSWWRQFHCHQSL